MAYLGHYIKNWHQRGSSVPKGVASDNHGVHAKERAQGGDKANRHATTGWNGQTMKALAPNDNVSAHYPKPGNYGDNMWESEGKVWLGEHTNSDIR